MIFFSTLLGSRSAVTPSPVSQPPSSSRRLAVCDDCLLELGSHWVGRLMPYSCADVVEYRT